jgi:N-acetylneuraminic acid mutarotase
MISAGSVAARDLTFEERLRAQEAIERVYYSHQIGTSEPFERSVGQDILERKVRAYLAKSAALQKFWNRPITADMLFEEVNRMSRHTQMPHRLLELYEALGNDPFLIQECLARPIVADRMARRLFASDPPPGASPADTQDDVGGVWDRWWRGVEGVDARAVRAVASTATIEAPLDVPRGQWETASGSSLGAPGDDPAAVAAPCSNDTWSHGAADAVPSARGQFTSIWTGTLMIIWGGEPNANTGGRYDPATDTWSVTSTDGAPWGRAHHTAVWAGDRMIVWGGQGVDPAAGQTILLNNGGLYDPNTDSWTALSTTGAPSPRVGATAVWTGSEMIVWGGSADINYFNTGGRYDPAHDRWAAISTTKAPVARADHASFWTGQRMIVWGGFSFDPVTHFQIFPAAGGQYDPVRDRWTTTSTLNAPAGRTNATVVWAGDRMIVWGGILPGVGDSNAGGEYNPAADEWATLPIDNAPIARHDHTAVWSGARMVIWGGVAGTASFDTGGRYDPLTRTWTPTSGVGAPSARSRHGAVWAGNEMVVWGGPDNTGGRYDPVSDTWRPTFTGGAPSMRTDHTAIWTGNQMIVWGGRPGLNGEVALQTGGIYDPVIDDWRPMSTIDAPSARFLHSAIWTGSRMIVWGGAGVNATLPAAGGIYDVAMDSWRATSTTDAPSGRVNHSAIWTGNRMIVWGGSTNSPTPTDYDSGGLYDPATDTWVPTPSLGSPSPRAKQTTVWTGSRMVIWGGVTSRTGHPDSDLNSGGRYDPAGNAWFPTSLVNAPSARHDHTAVWTGSGMIVWGGRGDSGVSTGTGAIYDPATDTWRSTTNASAPEARYGHTAVWNDAVMLIWGGEGASSFLQTGGRYDPVGDGWTPVSPSSAPSARTGHTAIWTAREMIVWGGYSTPDFTVTNDGGRYCACADAAYFKDSDEDGVGDSNAQIVSCGPPSGYVATGGDCDDSDPAVWGNPTEVLNDGFTDPTTLTWSAPASSGGTADVYDVLRSPTPGDFMLAASCIATDTAGTTVADADSPSPGGIYFYLVRAQSGCPDGQGSLGTGSDGTARTGRTCP